jgi:hypothetical protein
MEQKVRGVKYDDFIKIVQKKVDVLRKAQNNSKNKIVRDICHFLHRFVWECCKKKSQKIILKKPTNVQTLEDTASFN